MKEKEWDWK